MSYRSLIIFVEGADDIRFFEKIIKPKFESSKYQSVIISPYKNIKKNRVIKYIKTIKSPSMPSDYIFICDINDSPCVTLKKQQEQRIYHNIFNQERITVVKKEIESWYKAGLENNKCQQFKISTHTSTDNLTKEDFNRLIPKGFDRLTFMLEILDCFSVDCAITKNGSFKYFLQKYDC